MAIFNNMKDRLSQAGQSTVQKAKELSETAKLNSAISSAEKQLNELFRQVGLEICRAYRDNPQPEVAALMAQVNDLMKQMADWKAQIDAINAANLCPNCGARISRGMAFCSSCGAKLEIEPPAPAGRFCNHCGAQVPDDAVFCVSCGQRLDNP